jgi:hypothetical protein
MSLYMSLYDVLHYLEVKAEEVKFNAHDHGKMVELIDAVQDAIDRSMEEEAYV